MAGAMVRAMAWVCLCLLTGQSPSGDARKTADTGAISGRVYSSVTGAPVRDAFVLLFRIPETEGSPARRDSDATLPTNLHRTGSPDAGGRFEFLSLPAGRYLLIVAPGQLRGGYLSTAYGAVSPSDAGRRIVLGTGEKVETSIGLIVGSAIEGRVVDGRGEPVTGATVSAARVVLGSLARTTASPSPTDDLGRYRIYGLEPGEYVVAAEVSTVGAETGGVNADALVTTYHPDSLDGLAAQKVRVPPLQDVHGIDIQLIEARRYTLSGTIHTSEGQPPSPGQARATVMRRTLGGSLTRTIAVGADGRFIVRDLDPGDYILEVRGPAQPSPAQPAEFASLPLTLNQDVLDVVVTTQPGVTVGGRLVLAEGGTIDASRIQITLQGTTTGSQLATTSSSALDGDLRFTFKDAFGPKLLRPGALPAPWALAAVTLNGTDITDTPTSFRREDDGRVELIVTTRPATVEGTVRAEDGGDAAASTVYVFPEEKSFWRRWSARLRIVDTDEAGRFSVKGLPAGRYLAVAVARDGFRMPGDATEECFAALASKSVSLEIEEGRQRSVALRLWRALE